VLLKALYSFFTIILLHMQYNADKMFAYKLGDIRNVFNVFNSLNNLIIVILFFIFFR